MPNRSTHRDNFICCRITYSWHSLNPNRFMERRGVLRLPSRYTHYLPKIEALHACYWPMSDLSLVAAADPDFSNWHDSSTECRERLIYRLSLRHWTATCKIAIFCDWIWAIYAENMKNRCHMYGSWPSVQYVWRQCVYPGPMLWNDFLSMQTELREMSPRMVKPSWQETRLTGVKRVKPLVVVWINSVLPWRVRKGRNCLSMCQYYTCRKHEIVRYLGYICSLYNSSLAKRLFLQRSGITLRLLK